MLPFTIKYSFTLSQIAREKRYPEVVNIFKAYVRSRRGIIVLASDNELMYKGSARKMPLNVDIMVSVDKGVFKIEQVDGKTVIIYEIFLNSLIWFALFAGIVFSFLSGEIWIGLVAFLWLGGMNWISYMRHKSVLSYVSRKLERRLFNTSNSEQ